MKRIICIFALTVLLVFTLTACGGEKSEPWDTALVLEENGYNVMLTVGEKAIKTFSAEFGDFFYKGVYCVSFVSDEDTELNDFNTDDFGLFIYCNDEDQTRVFNKMEKAYLLVVDVVELVDGGVYVGSMDIWDIACGKK